jgi:hypothetical protein
MPADSPDPDRVNELYVAWTLAEESPPVAAPILSASGIVSFLAGNLTLSEEQQEYLFAQPRLYADFESLLRGYSASRTVAPRQEVSPADIAEIPMAAAASDDGALNDRIFPGAAIRIRNFGPEYEFLLTVTLRSWPALPAALLIRNIDARRLSRISLQGVSGGLQPAVEINLRRDVRRPDHAQQLSLLRQPTTVGVFLR